MNYERSKMIVDLTIAKIEILKLKADDYNWSCYTDDETRELLLQTLDDITLMLKDLKDT